VPQDARWTHLQAHAKQPTIGKTVDEAMDTIVAILSPLVLFATGKVVRFKGLTPSISGS
jgi:hypothetical protein